MKELEKVGGMVARARIKYIFSVRHNIWFLILTAVCGTMFFLCNTVHVPNIINYILYAVFPIFLLVFIVRISKSSNAYGSADTGILRSICEKNDTCFSKKATEKLLRSPRKSTHIFLKIVGGLLIALGIVAFGAQKNVNKLLHIQYATWLCYWVLVLAVFMFSISKQVRKLSESHKYANKCEECGRLFSKFVVDSSYRTVTERKKEEEEWRDVTVGYVGEGADRIPITKLEHFGPQEYDVSYQVKDSVWECKACGNRTMSSWRVYK